MTTISKILHLNWTNYNELDQLEIDWFINGCWWKWWINFDRYIKDTVSLFKEYLVSKENDLYKDLRTLCLIHDMMFWKKQWFYYSNYCLARNLFLLINWTWLLNRLWVSLWIFILTSVYWKKYYK